MKVLSMAYMSSKKDECKEEEELAHPDGLTKEYFGKNVV